MHHPCQSKSELKQELSGVRYGDCHKSAKELKLFRPFLRLITISKILMCFPGTTSTQKENKKAKQDLRVLFLGSALISLLQMCALWD